MPLKRRQSIGKIVHILLRNMLCFVKIKAGAGTLTARFFGGYSDVLAEFIELQVSEVL